MGEDEVLRHSRLDFKPSATTTPLFSMQSALSVSVTAERYPTPQRSPRSRLTRLFSSSPYSDSLTRSTLNATHAAPRRPDFGTLIGDSVSCRTAATPRRVILRQAYLGHRGASSRRSESVLDQRPVPSSPLRTSPPSVTPQRPRPPPTPWRRQQPPRRALCNVRPPRLSAPSPTSHG
jgi:hypothetical protein